MAGGAKLIDGLCADHGWLVITALVAYRTATDLFLCYGRLSFQK